MSSESVPDNDLRRLAQSLPKAKFGRKGVLTILVAVLVFLAILSWNWYSASVTTLKTQELRALESADKKRLEELADASKKDVIHRLARLQLARLLLRTEGLGKIGTSDPEKQKEALESIEKARDRYKAVLEEVKKYPSELYEVYMGLGKAEETLSSVGKGNLDEAIEYYKKAVAAVPDTELAKVQQKTIDTLEKNKAEIKEFYTKIIGSKDLTLPGLPPLGNEATPEKK